MKKWSRWKTSVGMGVLALVAPWQATQAASSVPAGRQDTRCEDCVTLAEGVARGQREAGVLVFKGLPYAAAPRGALRFRPPQPAPAWRGVRDARRYGPACPQLADVQEFIVHPPKPVHNRLLNAPTAVHENEDCLQVNAWTPAADGGKRPVMVYLHGGAFIGGSAASPLYAGLHLAQRDVVVVTLNYRLGVLGFLELGGLDAAYAGSGNNGLRDQIAALQWVQRNAAALGGDPDNVTVFGESAGSMSVSALLATRAPRRLFRRAIAQSGGPNLLHTRQFQHEAAELFKGYGPLRTVAALKRASVRELLMQQEVALRTYELGPSFFAAYVDGDLLPQDPYTAIAAGSARDIDLLAGATQDEMGYWSMYSPGDLNNMFVQTWHPAPGIDVPPARLIPAAVRRQVDAASPAGLDAVYRDWVAANDPPRGNRNEAQTVELTQDHDFMMILPMTRLAEAQQAQHANTYLYRFGWQVPRRFLADGSQALGAVHALELPFVFGVLPLLTDAAIPGGSAAMADAVQRAEVKRLSDTMMDAWVRFARTGDPNGGSMPAWPRYDPAQRLTMHWTNDAEGRVRAEAVADPDAARREVWRAWDFRPYPWRAADAAATRP